MNVIIAVNDVENAGVYVKQSCDLIKSVLKGAKATVLYVVERPEKVHKSLPDYLDKTSKISETGKEIAREHAEEFLKNIKTMFEKEGIAVETKLRFGMPSKEIVKLAGDAAYSILVWSAGFKGNEIIAIIQAAPCPVIIIGARTTRFTDRIKAVFAPNLARKPATAT